MNRFIYVESVSPSLVGSPSKERGLETGMVLNPIPPRGLIKGFTEFRPLLLLRLSWASREKKKEKGKVKRRKKEGGGLLSPAPLDLFPLSVNISNIAAFEDVFTRPWWLSSSACTKPKVTLLKRY